MEDIKRSEADFRKYYTLDKTKEVLKLAYKYKKVSRTANMKIIGAGIIGAILLGVITHLIYQSSIPGIIIGLFVGAFIGYLKFSKDREVYERFYYSHIPQLIANYAGINAENTTKSQLINYEATGLGDLYRYNKKNIKSLIDFVIMTQENKTLGKMYEVELEYVSKERVQTSSGSRTETRTDKVFEGFAFSLDINSNNDTAIRIDTDETFVSHLTEATVDGMTNDRTRFSFNTGELNKIFDCTIYPKNENLSKLVSQDTQKKVRDIATDTANGMLENAMRKTGFGNVLDKMGVDDVIKNEINNVSVNKLGNLFTSKEKQEEAVLNAHKIITPQVEELLLFLRKKYGPYSMVINNGINIQFAKEQSTLNLLNSDKSIFKKPKDYFKGFLNVSSITNDDLKCSRLSKMYELFMIEYLINKYFKKLTLVDSYSIENDSNPLYESDSGFFTESLLLDECSDNEMDKEDAIASTFDEITQKSTN